MDQDGKQECRRSQDSSERDYHPGKERRHLIRHPSTFIGILEKIPVFRGLSFRQLKKILGICKKQTFSENDAVCLNGEESYKMFILIKGELRVIFEDGKELSRITPLGIVGEMGVFTGERRSASVLAANECIVFTIHKTELFRIFRLDGELGIKVLMNVIQDMSHKLKNNNILIEELKQICTPDEYDSIISRALSDPESSDINDE